MTAAEIRRQFIEFFTSRGHTEVASGPLVPKDDPTLLFTNAGMVQFKRTFLGQDPRPYVRAVTCQKCVRAGGKHNDLEQVGLTRRHHTFFEMLGNFSFGDYFKRDAIAYAWKFLTDTRYLGLHPDQLHISVHHTDDEARKLWHELAGIPDTRIYGLGDADNFWQMGDTGPCGPCSEIYVDLEWQSGQPAADLTLPEFEVQAESGRFLEIWNLVFMQFDRSADGTLTPLPKPSVDTGAGLERIAAVMEKCDDNFHTDLFRPLIAEVERLVGAPYPGGPQGTGVSYRVLADHARAVSFLLLDGVYPSNEGRGFVVRRILRRAVRHAWLLGRREPTLVHLVPTVIATMGEAYPGLKTAQREISDWIRREEEGFLRTIEAGLVRIEQIRADGHKTIPGDEVFLLYDTFGFPPDLTEIIAGEMGMTVDMAGFEVAMNEQRERSRAMSKGGLDLGTELGNPMVMSALVGAPLFVGYDALEADTRVLSASQNGATVQLLIKESPFYPGGGGQIADTGVVEGDGWIVRVQDVQKDVQGRGVLIGVVEPAGANVSGDVRAVVSSDRRRDIQRNHSATHLAHMVLRRRLGDHVRQQGSLVEPGRLRFDFSHHAPVDAVQMAEIEAEINELVIANTPTDIREMSYPDALARGAMAFFADKYGDVVRVVAIGDSIELCGGTHVASAGEIGLFRVTSQGGVAAGVRRIEAVTGRAAYGGVRDLESRLHRVAESLRSQPDQIERRIDALAAERDKLSSQLAEMMKSGGGGAEVTRLAAGSATLVVSPTVSDDRAQLGALADEFRLREKSTAVLALVNPVTPTAIAFAVTDDLVARGKDANALMKHVAARFGGRGGGRPTFASGSLAVTSAERTAVEDLPQLLTEWLAT